MLDQEGYVRLTDFALSKENMDVYTHTSTVCGAPNYFAPEMIQYSSYTRAVDWWALGVVVHLMLFGKYPFTGDHCEELYLTIVRHEIVYRNIRSYASVIFISRLLQRQPHERLGYGENDAEDVKADYFFEDFNFEALLAKKIVPPFVPKLKNAEDMSYLDQHCAQQSSILTKQDEQNFCRF